MRVALVVLAALVVLVALVSLVVLVALVSLIVLVALVALVRLVARAARVVHSVLWGLLPRQRSDVSVLIELWNEGKNKGYGICTGWIVCCFPYVLFWPLTLTPRGWGLSSNSDIGIDTVVVNEDWLECDSCWRLRGLMRSRGCLRAENYGRQYNLCNYYNFCNSWDF